MYRHTITVPIRDNDGCTIPDGFWRVLRADLLQTFGGFTAYRVNGQWLPETGGAIFTDTSLRFECLDPIRLDWQLRTIAEYVKEHWHQECILVTVEEVDATFI